MKHVSRPELIRLASGELDDGERSEAEAHVEACEACRTALAEVSALRDLLGEWTVDASSRDAWSSIEQRLDAPSTAGSRSRRRWVAGASRIAAAILLGAGVGHTAGRLAQTTDVAEPISMAAAETASDEQAAEELGLYVFDSPTPAGLYAMVHDLTSAAAEGEVTP